MSFLQDTVVSSNNKDAIVRGGDLICREWPKTYQIAVASCEKDVRASKAIDRDPKCRELSLLANRAPRKVILSPTIEVVW